MTRLFLPLLLLMTTACSPGLTGAWQASGHLGRADAFDLDLSFETATRGLAVYATVDTGERAVPVCNVRMHEATVLFVIDTQGQTTCSTLSHPLTFQGILGHDVIAGRILDAAGAEVGIWRAFRREKRDRR